MSDIKLAVFDLEGTIFRNSYRGTKFPSIWKVLCHLCGPDAVAEDAAFTEKYLSGGYNDCYSAWVLDTLHILKKYGIRRNEFESLINEVDYYPGVEQTFETLRSKGMAIAVISGGLKALADRVANDFYVSHCFAAAELHWNPDGTIRHWNMQPTDFAHKRSVLKILCRDLGVSGDECLFVGDGRNDRAVAGFCALSIGFNPHDELRKDVDIIIEQPEGKENLAAILEPLETYPNFDLGDFSAYKIWRNNRSSDLSTSNLSSNGLKSEFRGYLNQASLTENSANSYCSYLNNLCKNVADISWKGATRVTAFEVLRNTAEKQSDESAFLGALSEPLSGNHGRMRDSISAVKQFHRFIHGRCYE